MLANLPPPTPKRIQMAVVGGGLMGHALAALMASAGATVSIFESDPGLRETLPWRIDLILAECPGDRSAALTPQVVETLEGLAPDTHLVIEAIPEDLQLKQNLFATLEQLLPHAILATNSSVYRVGDVSALMIDPSRAIGTHWWNPPHLVPIVEVTQGKDTPPENVEWTIALLRDAGKAPVHVRVDTPGFIGNRLQHALWREALAIVEEGLADATTVDMVARGTLGLKLGALGPLENADYVGLDLTHAIHTYLLPALSSAVTPSPLLTDANREGRLGAKTGGGLMEWPLGRREELASRLAAHIRSQLTATR